MAALPKAPGEGNNTYPLHINDLTSLMSYTTSPAGVSITALKALPAGALFSPITTSTPASAKRWSTVQTSRDTHIELNSALLYMNHSCAPSLEVDTKKMEVRVARDRDLKVGDELTFFYPSTEWEFDSPFRCLCAEKGCVREVSGAKVLSGEELKRWFVNEHIWTLVEERDGGKK